MEPPAPSIHKMKVLFTGERSLYAYFAGLLLLIPLFAQLRKLLRSECASRSEQYPGASPAVPGMKVALRGGGRRSKADQARQQSGFKRANPGTLLRTVTHGSSVTI